MSVHTHTYATPAEAADACCRHVIAVLEEALSGERDAMLAVSGGATPAILFDRLAATRFRWDRVQLFWVDERAVPPSDPSGNYRLAEEHLIRPSRFPSRNVHRIHGELRPEVAARQYAAEIRDCFRLEPGEMPHFDLMLRGVGADYHTASLFPGEPLINDREGIAAAVFVEKLNQWRITLLPAVLLAARHTAMFVTGAEKAEAVRAIFQEPYDPMKYPAQMVSHHGRKITWFLDDEAAQFID